MNDDTNDESAERINLGSAKLRSFFIDHLNRIYSAKNHLLKNLPALEYEARYSDLKSAVAENVENVEKQIVRMQMIYTLLEELPSPTSSLGLTALVDDAFDTIQHEEDPELRDLSIAFYIQSIESVEIASFQILRMAAVKINNKQVERLLNENFQEAKADRTLFLLISTKYLTS